MTEPAPTFTQYGALPLYVISSSADSGVAGYWAGYRPSAQPAFGATATLDQVWQDAGGTYVFAAARPADDAAFSAALDALLHQLSPTGLVRMIWIADATLPTETWQVATLAARATGAGSAIAWSVAGLAVLAVGEYAVEIGRNTPLTQSSTALGFGIAADSLTFAGPTTTCVSTAGSAWLPLAGPQLGCWCAVLPVPVVTGQDALSGLRVGLRYAAPHGDGALGDTVDILDLPVVAQGNAALTLHLCFDWLNPLLRERTCAGFFDAAGTGDPGPALAATLRTSRGYSTTLAPRAHGAPLRPAGLVLCRSPLAIEPDAASTSWVYHLAPDGAFDLAVVPPEVAPTSAAPHRVMFGLSGQEYAALQAGAGGTVLFSAGEAAFAPGAAPAALPAPPNVAPLTGAATTAYLALLPPGPGDGLSYYAQPRQAPLHAGGGALGAGVLEYLEIAAGTLPPWTAGATTPPAAVPSAPLAGIDPMDAEFAQRIEQRALAPARRRAIGLAPDGLRAALDDNGTLAVTPQGLLVEVGASKFERVVIAALPATPQQRLDISAVGPRLRRALQTNELFFAIGDPAAFLADSSIQYRLDETGLIVAAARGVPPDVIAALRPIVVPEGVPQLFATEQAFDTAVATVAGTYLPLLQEIAGFLKAVLSGWTFQLSPRAWRTGDDRTVMIFKYAHRSIAELADDGGAWSWPEAAGDAQAVLRQTLKAARKRAEDPTLPADDPYIAFYRDVLAEPFWNGVLVLNAPVSISELPAELQFMAAGIDQARFFAHHLGFSATPVGIDDKGAIAVRQTAAFGLIDYQDPTDLVITPSAPNPDFGFKTLTLTARFANAALVSFHARVELMVNRLLGAPLTKIDPTHGNNLLLTGSSQRQGGVISYAFVLEGEHRYDTRRTVLDSIQIDTVRVLTSAGADAAGDVVSSFALGGFLRFDDHPAFDIFGYGPTIGDPSLDARLRFGDLAVQMRFPLGTAGQQFFAVSVDGTRLDTRQSTARTKALIENFPVALTGLAGSTTRSPQEAGFTSISAPINQSPLTGEWWALSYRLDLGTLGALAGSTGLSLGLLAAWGAGATDNDAPVYVGLRLPGGMQWSLQGVLKLGFRSFQFQTLPTKAGGLAYLLRLRRFALRVLGISLPPGNIDVTLFGDSEHPKSRVVGWYAAYDSDPPKKKELTS